MIWFKHPTNSSTHDQLTGAVLAVYGIEGYARLYLLIEAIASQMKVKEDDPTAKYHELKWCNLLHCKRKVLHKFLNDLQKIEAIKYEQRGESIRVSFHKVTDLLDNRAASSRLRGASGYPRSDQNLDEMKEEQQEQSATVAAGDKFSWMTETLRGSNVKRELPSLAIKHWIKFGVDKEHIDKIGDRVRQQFSSTERARRQGEVVIAELRKAFALWHAHASLPKTLRRTVTPEFLVRAIEKLHIPLAYDKEFVAAYDRCKARTMDAADIVYIKAKMKTVENSIPAWVKDRQDILAIRSKQ